MSNVTPLREDDRPEGNFRRVLAGATLSAADILAGWQRIIRISQPEQGASAEPAVIELPPARRWLKPELIVVDAAGAGFVLRLAGGGDAIYGATEGHVDRPVLRLVPLLSDQHDEADAWAVA